MNAITQLLNKISILFHGDRFKEELDEEMAFHREQREKELRDEGMSPEAAHHAAMREFGNAARLKDESQEIVSFTTESVLQDFRYALRQFRRNPGFAFAVIVILGLGIGATTAIFSVVNPILFKSLPYSHPGRIMSIQEVGSDGSRNRGTFGMYRGLVERSRLFESMSVLMPWQPAIIGANEPERLEGQRVSASYFHVLGVAPHMGRDFDASDDRLRAPNVVILSNALWRRRFGGDPAIIGRQITLDDSVNDEQIQRGSYLVIGVMPENFENVLAPTAELWAPVQYDMGTEYPAWGHVMRTVGRVRPGVTVDQATREINTLGQEVLKAYHPSSYGRHVQFVATSLQEDLTRGVKPALLAVLGAVLLVLIIACVNVTNLLLARGVQRRGEFAMRAALGAGRRRLIRQLLTESLLLAAIGGAAGIAVAKLGVRALVAISPVGLPRVGAIGIDSSVFAFGLGITTLIGLIFGLTPALQAARSDPNRDLQHGSRSIAGGHRRTRSGLVVAEVALALVLLICSGLLLRSLERLIAVTPGFDSSNLLTMQIQTSGHRFDDSSATYLFFNQALEAVRHVPGVTAAGLTSDLPLSGDLDEYGAHFEATPTQPAESSSVFRYAVSPGYLETMHIPLRSGRLLNEHDGPGAPRVALISESLAKLRFPAADPVGQRLRLGPTDGQPYTIVGVVGDVKQMSLALNQSDAVYINASQSWFADSAMSLVVRDRGNAVALAPAIRLAIWSVDKDQPIVRIATMDSLVAASEAQRHFALILFEAFALVALLLAAAGIYGVLAGSVAERTREIGIRSALGASRRNILALVVRQGMQLTVFGAAIGLIGSIAASQAILSLLFGVSPLDPLTYFGVVALLLGVAALACWVPAWRAARVDPASTLRAE